MTEFEFKWVAEAALAAQHDEARLAIATCLALALCVYRDIGLGQLGIDAPIEEVREALDFLDPLNPHPTRNESLHSWLESVVDRCQKEIES